MFIHKQKSRRYPDGSHAGFVHHRAQKDLWSYQLLEDKQRNVIMVVTLWRSLASDEQDIPSGSWREKTSQMHHGFVVLGLIRQDGNGKNWVVFTLVGREREGRTTIKACQVCQVGSKIKTGWEKSVVFPDGWELWSLGVAQTKMVKNKRYDCNIGQVCPRR